MLFKKLSKLYTTSFLQHSATRNNILQNFFQSFTQLSKTLKTTRNYTTFHRSAPYYTTLQHVFRTIIRIFPQLLQRFTKLSTILHNFTKRYTNYTTLQQLQKCTKPYNAPPNSTTLYNTIQYYTHCYKTIQQQPYTPFYKQLDKTLHNPRHVYKTLHKKTMHSFAELYTAFFFTKLM